MTDRYTEDTTLIVVDVQNDFADPDGGLYVPEGDQVIPVINREIAAARDADAAVVYTQDWHPPRTPHFETDGGEWPVHCVQGTWGAELHPDLEVEGPVVKKGVDGGDGYSGFSVRDPVSGEESATELGRLLDERGARRLVVTGLAGDVCVKETALDGRRLGYEVVVPLAATRMVDADGAEGALDELRDADVEIVDE